MRIQSLSRFTLGPRTQSNLLFLGPELQIGIRVRLSGVRLLQDAGTERARTADGTAAVLVPVLVKQAIKESDEINPC